MADEKDQKKEKLKEVEDKLNDRVEDMMGKAPENINTVDELPSAPTVPKAAKVKEPKPPKTAPASPGPEETIEDAEKKAQAETEEAQEDPELDKAVDDIAAKESDDILAAEDNAIADAFTDKKPQGGLMGLLKRWWGNKTARWLTILVILGAIAAVAIVPVTRYKILNAAGVRSSASLTVIDQSTQQPLKNVSVRINNATGTTNDEGQVTLREIMLGETQIIVERRAFATLSRDVTIGWGSNPLGDVSIVPTGLQYEITVKDFLSGKPIEKAEATSGDASAFSDKDGKILLTLDTKGDEKVEITIKANGYREEKVTDTGDKNGPTQVQMAPNQKQAFISKSSGKYDVYKIDADGKNRELVFSGSGHERADIALVQQPQGNTVALVSTRNNVRNAEGLLLSTLTLLDIESNKATSLDTSVSVQVVGWIGNDLVYVVAGDETGANKAREQKLVSYNIETEQKTDIVTSTNFNSAMIAGDKIYYAPAAEVAVDDEGNQKRSGEVGLFQTDSNGANRQKLLDKEVWAMIRTSYETVALSTEKQWYEYQLGATRAEKTAGGPASQVTRVYENSPNNSSSLWVDRRDGKGALIMYNLSKKTDTTLTTQSGLSYPVRWLNNSTVVFRVQTDQEVADYVMSTSGGEPKKITDVTATAGTERWYYY